MRNVIANWKRHGHTSCPTTAGKIFNASKSLATTA
jgi:hypothetical protein